MTDREKIEYLLESAGHKVAKREVSSTAGGRRYYFTNGELVRVIDYETNIVATPTETRSLT